ncbi:RagB/SusD family nutrient uptake outer membrane protein [Polaribacter aquimarinus]|uniref:RagB/SusD family nutrient uptake outer membrane protein n=1 Tax=Polaribacter aquimarinus TaxID=2100726 RepID=A0A2U2J8S6_9FLAO|nr:RagB/SusD family nutrient uptake outer membrane protein [Polaribacter aquimarinus]PWG04740.1 RagB/SusD family nutrient uptake outer membrane protein [Polaribacter aquimarinus]
MKNIKTHIKIVALLGVLLSTFSCSDEFLSPAPTAAVSGANFYTTEDQVFAGIINMYDGIQGVNDTRSDSNHGIQMEFYVTEMRSDNTRTKSGEGEASDFDFFRVQPENGLVADHYRSFYNVIFRANKVLESLDVVSSANKDKFEAEARFIRAYVYFNMVRLYGDIPLVDKVITPDDTDIQFTRVPTAQIYDFIINDFQFAIQHLDNSGSKNRGSKAAAQGLLAKVYLTTKEYTKAQLLLEEVMKGSYILEPNFSDVFYNENNKEVIFSIGFIQGLTQDSQNFSAEFLNGVGRTVGVNYVTNDAKTALDNLGGTRTAVSYRQDKLQLTQNQVAKYLPNGEDGGADGKTFTGLDPRLAGNDWIVLRYADILLMHVEAILAGGNETSVGAALASFQAVRNRAGLTTAVTKVTLEELLDERRVELAFENQRMFDLIRFGKAQEILSAFSIAIGGSFSSTDLLLPIPQNEIGLSRGKLTQNPGY